MIIPYLLSIQTCVQRLTNQFYDSSVFVIYKKQIKTVIVNAILWSLIHQYYVSSFISFWRWGKEILIQHKEMHEVFHGFDCNKIIFHI